MKKVLLFLLLTGALAACRKEKETNYSGVAGGQINMAKGTSWAYEDISLATDSASGDTISYTRSETWQEITNVNFPLPEGLKGIELSEHSKIIAAVPDRSPLESFSKTYYRYQGDTLQRIAYTTGAGVAQTVFMRSANGTSPVLQSRAFDFNPFVSRQASDSLIVEQRQVISFLFPLKVDKSWTCFNIPFLGKRKVLGTLNVKVPAGTFLCYDVVYTIGETDSPFVTVHQYVAVNGRGIVKQVQEGFAVGTNEEAEEMNTLHFQVESQLLH